MMVINSPISFVVKKINWLVLTNFHQHQRRTCRFQVVCGNTVLHEEAYCYTEGTDCEKWYSGRSRYTKEDDSKSTVLFFFSYYELIIDCESHMFKQSMNIVRRQLLKATTVLLDIVIKVATEKASDERKKRQNLIRNPNVESR